MHILPNGHLLGGQFRVVRLLGVGSWSTVYLCESLDLADYYAAVKVVSARNVAESAASRFRTEITACFEVDHPNVVRPYTFFQEDGLLILALEYVEGGDLRRRMKLQGVLPKPVVVNILERLADALVEIHEIGVIHRDIKPDNVLLPALNLPKLADFGVAVLSGGPRFTGGGEVIGTVHYVSPEYVATGRLDFRSDIYSLGVLGYELLSGRVPFEGDTVTQVLNAKVIRQSPDVREFSADVPAPLAEILKRSLERDPAKRYQSAAEFRDALQKLMKGPNLEIGQGRG